MAKESIRLILCNDLSSTIDNCKLHSLFALLVGKGEEGEIFKCEQERKAWDISNPREGVGRRVKPFVMSFAALNSCNNALNNG